MADGPKRLSLRFLFETGLCAMAIGSYPAILIHVLQKNWDLDTLLGCFVVGPIFSVGFAVLFCGFIPLDENWGSYVDAWTAILVSFGVLVALATRQPPLPETAAAIAGVGPLCRCLLQVIRYTRYAWLIFIPVGTVLGILCIACLCPPDPRAERRSGDE